MYFLTEPVELEKPLFEFGDYLYPTRYGGFTKISNGRLDRITGDYGSIDLFIREMLDRQSAGLPSQLSVPTGWSEWVALRSLQVDRISQGDVDEELVPDVEGRERIVRHRRYERSPRNRERAIEVHGTTCTVCGFNFDEFYGRDYADGYIQIHHIKPLSEHEGAVDPATDLVPLCANCHVMAHRRRTTVTSIEELKALIDKAAG